MAFESGYKDHPNYEKFLRWRENRDWAQFASITVKTRLADMLAEIDRFDDITSTISTNLKGFSRFRIMGSDSFDPVVDRKTLETGLFGKLWTASIMVNREYSDGLTFASDMGRKLSVSDAIWDMSSEDWRDSIKTNFDAKGKIIEGATV